VTTIATDDPLAVGAVEAIHSGDLEGAKPRFRPQMDLA
jgi:hypothetical protein